METKTFVTVGEESGLSTCESQVYVADVLSDRWEHTSQFEVDSREAINHSLAEPASTETEASAASEHTGDD